MENLIFEKDFKDKISKETIQEKEKLKQEQPAKALAILIAYVLKFKQKDTEIRISRNDSEKIKERSLELYRQTSTAKNRFNIQWIAASIAIALLIGSGAYWIGKTGSTFPDQQQGELIEISTPKGQQSELTLPDGTFVALNYDSKLRYRISGKKSLQEVELDGEAFFKVKKNKSRTFRVITDDMEVTDIGTEFNVHAYKNDLRTETTLIEGSVQISDIGSQRKPVVLQPNEKWSYNKQTQQYSVKVFDAKLSTLWRNGEYYFDKVPLDEIANTLERMYKVDIQFLDTSLENEKYTGRFYKNDDVNTILSMINLTVPIEIKKDHELISIDRRK